MIKNTIKINRPLTVIAVFSMLTEASAAVSLPYIDSEHQKIYVGLLIISPSLLITLFFLTLNFNKKNLIHLQIYLKPKTLRKEFLVLWPLAWSTPFRLELQVPPRSCL